MSSCSCGHHHHHDNHHRTTATGTVVTLNPAPVALTGQLVCADMGQMMTALTLLPDHVTASRAEPGCLKFDLTQGDDPLIWNLSELFADEDAFAAHQTRTKASEWGLSSQGIRREFTTSPATVRIRPETAQDGAAIAALLRQAFGGDDEARLVDALRRDGDLALSLVAESEGVILGHIALSPVTADQPTLALAPLAVHPALQGRGLGAALTQSAMAAFADHGVVVLGDPAYYGRFGFASADLDSPYRGPHLMTAGPALPAGARIEHAPAFAGLG